MKNRKFLEENWEILEENWKILEENWKILEEKRKTLEDTQKFLEENWMTIEENREILEENYIILEKTRKFLEKIRKSKNKQPRSIARLFCFSGESCMFGKTLKPIKMSKTTKLIIAAAILLFAGFTQQAQAQETKEYATVMILQGGGWNDFAISYPDGTSEKGKLAGSTTAKNLEPNAIMITEMFNKLAEKGYKLVSSSGGDYNSVYVFEK